MFIATPISDALFSAAFTTAFACFRVIEPIAQALPIPGKWKPGARGR
jgi:hypothetical protein